MKNHICDTCKLDMELVPLGCHRHNAAKVAIRNFKAHFLSVLAGVADDFPPNLWDWLLPQTEITINLIQQSNATPNVSAYAHLSRPFDYNKMPLAPMRCEAQVHEKTDKRSTWAYHLVARWYLFTSPEHYCTHNCHIKHTKSKQLSDTVQFQHKCITNPSITHANKVMQALAKCIKAIQGMTGKDRNSQAPQDLQHFANATQACILTNLHQFEESSTPDYIRKNATSSEGADTSKHSHTPYQRQQMNHVLHANTGTSSKGAQRHSYSQTNQRAPRRNHHRIKQQTLHISCRVIQTQTPA